MTKIVIYITDFASRLSFNFFWLDDSNGGRILSNFRCSLPIRSILSFELDDECISAVEPNDDEKLFAQTIQPVHI
jgi:hypothetical protein